jgi:DNA end-binding protein Ku
MRDRTYLGAITSNGSVLCLTTLRYDKEVVKVKAFKLPDIALSAKELDMARALVEQFSGVFEPDEFHDEYYDRLMSLIEKKAKGKKVTVSKPKVKKSTKDNELIEAIKASLDQAKKLGKKSEKVKGGK